jgi:proton-dependent oligopeptide transporter, POT family
MNDKSSKADAAKKISKELTEPFINIFKSSKALFGVNIVYLLEGVVYFGILGLLVLYFEEYIGLNDIKASYMVGMLTAGITLSMLFLGGTVDWIGVRKAFLTAFIIMLIGRLFLTIAPSIGSPGLWQSANLYALAGIFFIIIGYGIFQPAAYTAVKKFTTKENAAMGYAMLYAIMNLGGFLPGLISPPVRHATGIIGVYWVYNILTAACIMIVIILITKKSVHKAELKAKEGNNKEKEEKEKDDPEEKPSFKYYIKNIPIRDTRFLFFIFILIFVQTLYAYNWLILPVYTSRAFTGIVSDYFEFFTNLNPLLIFILAPIVTALTIKKKTYNMMIIGTLIMALPTFILCLGANIYTLLTYLFIMTIGEAIWQPRFLQWVAEIAPKNMTGIYMGLGQFPWFLTKAIVPIYSGYFLINYCPKNTPHSEMNTETMWFIFGCVAIITPIALFLAKKWMEKCIVSE